MNFDFKKIFREIQTCDYNSASDDYVEKLFVAVALLYWTPKLTSSVYLHINRTCATET